MTIKTGRTAVNEEAYPGAQVQIWPLNSWLTEQTGCAGATAGAAAAAVAASSWPKTADVCSSTATAANRAAGSIIITVSGQRRDK